MSPQRGFTYIETMIATFMVIASLALMSQMMMRPVDQVKTLSPRAQDQQVALSLAQDQAEQLRASLPAAPLTSPSPRPTPAGTGTAFHLSVIDETALSEDVAAGTTIKLNSCTGIFDGGSLQVDVPPLAQTVTVSGPPSTVGTHCQVTLAGPGLAAAHSRGAVAVPVIPAGTGLPRFSIFQQFFSALVTAPRYGSALSAPIVAATTSINVHSIDDFHQGSLVVVDSGPVAELATVAQDSGNIHSVTGNTVLLDSPGLALVHSNGANVSLVSLVNASQSQAGKYCLGVQDSSLFRDNVAVQIGLRNTDPTFESGIVACVGTDQGGCTCDLAAVSDPTKQLVLTRPLRNAHDSEPIAPAIYSAISFSIISGGGQKLGI